MATSFSPAQTGQSRVFVIEGRARPDHKPAYWSSVKAGAISQSFGDIEKIEVPDPNQFDKFVEIGTIRGAKERATITLTGRYAREIKSEMLRLARAECAADVQINLGACTDPSAWNLFQKKLILEDARLTSWDSEDIGALGSDERAKVDESVNVSATDVYEIVQVVFAEKAGDTVTLEVVDLVICDTASCGDCSDIGESSGCDKIFGVTIAAGGSPSTPADVVFSLDKGVTWDAHDIETMSATDNGSGIECLGDYLFVVSLDTESLHYALKSEFDGVTDPVFAEVTTGFVASSGPNAVDVAGGKAFIAANAGYIYSTEDVTASVTVDEDGTIYTDNYLDISALTEEFVVAVGNAGRIIKTENGTTWALVASPVGVEIDLNAILVVSESTWFIGTSGGQLYYTVDGGTTWTEKTFTGSGAGVVRDIIAASDSVLYLSHDTAAPLGRILRSSNGGYDWIVMPEGTGSLPLNDRITALASCSEDPDFVVGGGLGDDASDGYIVVGTA